jgi:predicted aconitase with swiveling domain
VRGEPIPAVVLAPGRAAGAVLVLAEPVSFWGGFDAETGCIIDRWHPQCGTCLTDRVLVMRSARGSSSGSSVFAEAVRRGTAPTGIVLLSRDAILTTGALVAEMLYGQRCPIVVIDEDGYARVTAAERVAIEADGERARIRLG